MILPPPLPGYIPGEGESVFVDLVTLETEEGGGKPKAAAPPAGGGVKLGKASAGKGGTASSRGGKGEKRDAARGAEAGEEDVQTWGRVRPYKLTVLAANPRMVLRVRLQKVRGDALLGPFIPYNSPAMVLRQ